MKPVKDADGTILNAAVLRDSQVVRKRVRCPGCGVKVFKKWPGGWDGHAANSCSGLESTSEVDRKTEFKTAFRTLFRR